MAEITWAMWNCSGLLPTSSSHRKIDFLNSYKDTKFNIVLLVETHHKTSRGLHAQTKNQHYTIANLKINLKYEFLFQNHPT